MKKCPNCDAVSFDEESVCGVCRTSLAGTTSVSLQRATQIDEPSVQMKTKTKWTGIIGQFFALFLGVFFGLGLTIVGISGLFFPGPLSLPSLLAGLGILFVLFLWIDSGSPVRSRRDMSGRRGLPPLTEDRESLKEDGREAAEERDRKSGASD